MSISNRTAHSDSDNASDDICCNNEKQEDQDLPSYAAENFPCKLITWEFNQCDRKRCTSRKLVRLRYVKPLRFNCRFFGVVLFPEMPVSVCFSPKDTAMVLSRGLGLVDCSWHKIDEIPFQKLRVRNCRCLPYLIACNPTNYGKAFQLSCVEAYAAALYIIGLHEAADIILQQFKWGPTFTAVNKKFLDSYSACNDEQDILKVQETFMNGEIERPTAIKGLFDTSTLEHFNPNREINDTKPGICDNSENGHASDDDEEVRDNEEENFNDCESYKAITDTDVIDETKKSNDEQPLFHTCLSFCKRLYRKFYGEEKSLPSKSSGVLSDGLTANSSGDYDLVDEFNDVVKNSLETLEVPSKIS